MSANVGHGHVFPRPDGVKARCGGPGLCEECSLDAGRKPKGENVSPVGKFKYTVESREPSDYTELWGPWVTNYMGPDGIQAMAEAESQAKRGRQAQVVVTVKREAP